MDVSRTWKIKAGAATAVMASRAAAMGTAASRAATGPAKVGGVNKAATAKVARVAMGKVVRAALAKVARVAMGKVDMARAAISPAAMGIRPVMAPQARAAGARVEAAMVRDRVAMDRAVRVAKAVLVRVATGKAAPAKVVMDRDPDKAVANTAATG